MKEYLKYLKGDRVIWIITLIMLAFSLVSVYSFVPILVKIEGGTPFKYLFKHFTYVVIAFIAMYWIHKKDSKYKYFFRYGPKLSSTNEQKNIMFDNDAYKINVPYSEIIVHCFIISESHKEFSPTLFESLILNKYLKLFNNDLPPANNSL